MNRFRDTTSLLSAMMLTPRVPMDILLIEDQDDEIVMVQEAFEETKLNNRMVVAKNPSEALMYLRQCQATGTWDPALDSGSPGLILLDVDIADHHGLDILHDIRSDPLLMTIPIVVLTDTLDESDLACTMAHGVTGYFLKPMDSAQLRKVVRDVEEHWNLLMMAPCAN